MIGLAAQGTLTVPSMENVTLSYSYDPLTTANKYNIHLFTQPTEYVFVQGASFPPLYQMFADYYGSDTFYDDFARAALEGESITLANGEVDFSSYSDEARAGKYCSASSMG